jgi:hypothetical protein
MMETLGQVIVHLIGSVATAIAIGWLLDGVERRARARERERLLEDFNKKYH